MTMKTNFGGACLSLLLIGGLWSCSKKKEGDSVSAQLSLGNSTAAALTAAECPLLVEGGTTRGDTCYTPTSYGVKILKVFVSPDKEGAITGPAGLIWANTACAVATAETDIDDKTFTYESVGADCTDDKVTTFFELARPTAEVNTELNAQNHKILPGTYNYVQLEFCNGGAKSKNAQFNAAGMSETYQLTANSCGISSIKADPPIVVGEGESVTVSLAYDLTNIIYTRSGYADPAYCSVSADTTVVRCFNYLNNLKPSFAKR